MDDIIKLLHTGGYSCVIENNGEVRTFWQRGVADLYDLLNSDSDFLKGASVADKVIGKGAAALMILGGAREVYTDLISQPALMLFNETDIEVKYEQSVPLIRNRDKTGWCPLETICLETKSAAEAFPLIQQFVVRMRSNQTN
ncbi:DUF1893 domain-containing protein [Dysgonomonas sp. 511]|uniref:DUF1893 domain-containing protein n=1 Tax=Dysgonomonas sp. 511 TaxID=2302930 RepID=UPI0013D103CA|nr:DUF1893 domain-containing protein [Dysgonomonas sp. 511]NDV79906.1 DUF1893 domain-containing protein [Dysgonomonas sp. 511]